MEVDATIGSTATATGTTSATAAGSLGSFDKDMFLKLFVAQLRQQSPFDAVETKDFMIQMAQFSSVEALQNMSTSMDVLRRQQGLAMGSTLIGRQVQYFGIAAELLTGVVDRVTQANGAVFLQVNGAQIGLDDVRAVLSL